MAREWVEVCRSRNKTMARVQAWIHLERRTGLPYPHSMSEDEYGQAIREMFSDGGFRGVRVRTSGDTFIVEVVRLAGA